MARLPEWQGCLNGKVAWMAGWPEWQSKHINETTFTYITVTIINLDCPGVTKLTSCRWLHYRGGCITKVAVLQVILPKWMYYRGGDVTKVSVLQRWLYYQCGCTVLMRWLCYQCGCISEVAVLPRWRNYGGGYIMKVTVSRRWLYPCVKAHLSSVYDFKYVWTSKEDNLFLYPKLASIVT